MLLLEGIKADLTDTDVVLTELLVSGKSNPASADLGFLPAKPSCFLLHTPSIVMVSTRMLSPKAEQDGSPHPGLSSSPNVS